jgi:hypothetical protein
MFMQAQGATLSVKGNLLCSEQDASIKLSGLPLDVFRPLVQASLPNLHAARVEPPRAFQQLLQPFSTFQRQIRRATEALTLPHGPLGPPGSTAEATPAPVQGRLFVDGTITGSMEQPEGDLRMRVDNAVLGTLRLSEASAKAKYGRDGIAHVDAVVSPAAASGRVDLDCRMELPSGKKLQGAVVVRDGGMLVLSELAGDSVQWLDGRATLRVEADGSIAAPRLAAEAQFSRTQVAVMHLKEPLRGLSGKVRLADDAVTVSNLQASCGRSGALRASGWLPLQCADDGEVRFCSLMRPSLALGSAEHCLCSSAPDCFSWC